MRISDWSSDVCSSDLEYARPIPVERLAALAGMSPSAFHQHFRTVTSLSPLQFQKHPRLIEARRRMLTEGERSSSEAFAVGYESVSQCTQEYGRMFGMPPIKDAKAALQKTMDAWSWEDGGGGGRP